jgi:hypothetical protein
MREQGSQAKKTAKWTKTLKNETSQKRYQTIQTNQIKQTTEGQQTDDGPDHASQTVQTDPQGGLWP